MDVLIACERSGRVRDAFIARGHNAISIDLEPTDTPGPHIEGDARNALTDPWDMVIAFPPCTDLAASGARWWKDKNQQPAIDLFIACYNARAPKICVENPVGIMSTLLRKPDQYVQPHWFGHPWTKTTGLWLRGLPKLTPTHPVQPTAGGYTHKYRGGDFRRSLTPKGLALAMAEQWG